MAFEHLLGRSLAFCCHPCAAWRVLPRSGRLLLACAWLGAAYVCTLAMLVIWQA